MPAVLLAIVADTHMPRGGRRLPDGCVKRLEAAKLIVHAGDLCTIEVLRGLETHGPVAAVHGNLDTAEVRRVLPEALTLSACGARLGVVHDAGPSRGRLARLRRRFPDADAVVFGHSHVPLHARDATGLQIFNPGSPTDRRRAPRHTMGVAHVAGEKVEFELVGLD